MINITHKVFSLLTAACLALATQGLAGPVASAPDPLPSWNEGMAKKSITEFVAKVSDRSSPNFIATDDRIAVFDNDGTLWSEKPYYNQLAFAIDRIHELAPQHPEWQHEDPFKSILAGDLQAALAGGTQAATKLIAASHAGMTSDEFTTIVKNWTASAEHPTLGRLYTQCVYKPMLEVMNFLRANDFKVYIVSGGGADFMRPWTEKVYGVPPEQVIGSRIKLEFKIVNGEAVLERLPDIAFIDDGPGKPIAIQQIIGRRPIAAFGNSDGDLQMLQYTTMQLGPSLGVIVHHTDAEREWAYDRDSEIGRLETALDDAPTRGWTVIDMKKDWRVVF